MQLADQAIGSYQPFLGTQANLLSEAAGTMRSAADIGGQGDFCRVSSRTWFNRRGSRIY